MTNYQGKWRKPVSEEELAARLGQALATPEQRFPELQPVKMESESETQLARRVMAATEIDPRTTPGMSQDEKMAANRQYYESEKTKVEALKVDWEKKTQRELEVMNLGGYSYNKLPRWAAQIGGVQ